MAWYEGTWIPPEPVRIAVIVSRFNQTVTDGLLKGCQKALAQHGVTDEQIDIIVVPGAFEIPGVVFRLLDKPYHAIIALGAVIRGETPHFDYVASAVTQGLARAAHEGRIPVVFGILTTDTVEQAEARAGGKSGNKGVEAALTALEMMSLYRQL